MTGKSSLPMAALTARRGASAPGEGQPSRFTGKRAGMLFAPPLNQGIIAIIRKDAETTRTHNRMR